MKKFKWQKLANEYGGALFPIFMLTNSLAMGVKELLGKGSQIPFKIEKGAVTYYFRPAEWKAAHNLPIAKIKKRPGYMETVLKKIEILGKRQVRRLKTQIGKLEHASNSELWRIYQNFMISNGQVYDWGLLLPLIDYNEDTFLSDEVARILKTRKAEKYFVLLTTPARQTYLKFQDLDLYKIYGKIRNNRRLSRIFKKMEADQIIVELSKFPRVRRALAAHAKKYDWVFYVYLGPVVDLAYFVGLIKDLIGRGVNPQKELAKEAADRKKLSGQQIHVESRLKLDQYEKRIIALARDVVFYKPYRRELQSWAYRLMEPVLREIGKRLHLSLGQVRMMLPREIQSALKKGRIDHGELHQINERSRFLLYGAPRYNSCLGGEDARRYCERNMAPEKKIRKVKIFIGTTAYPGKVRGRVKIVNSAEEISKMERGDVLVAVTTNPNLMPAIRLAAAIVTNEGGLTCHAAIVSRELRIPCVVGTEIAANVLKDGDKVEVDAGTGVVKIFK